ncbi:GntR family transcriptional regulator [Rhodococcus qingshengii]|uniref:GntR family transcriptional regulator n=1 Tax=Rhodococcus qingshengii TaxID=334542 RepID=UPI00071E5E0B|nr:GntR family transcriptional regulator [Rhodococcus qingshengii]KSU73783.1 GntR family transcriptional regulator [Rhodococcus qingshengii]SCC52054.1 transcriptional regulator, GntR family [Rhodococcus qingshengii]
MSEADSANGPTTVASHRIAAHIREDILSGRLLPGVRIRQEEIAERLGASRLPVREALRMLESEGLVELKANSGAWVSSMDMQECDFVYRIRERIEPMALAESIPHLNSSVHDRLWSIQDEIEANEDVDRFLVLDRELHLLTYSGCEIPQLITMVTRFWNTTQHYRRAYARLTGPDRTWVINYEHRLLIEAIVRIDEIDAERCLTGHIRRTRTELTKHPELFDSTNPDSSRGGSSKVR